MDVVVRTYGFRIEVPDDLHVEALYPTDEPDGDPSLDLRIAMEPGRPPDLSRLCGVMLLEQRGANPWPFSLSVCASGCLPLAAAEFAQRFRAGVEGRGEQFDGLTENLQLAWVPAFEVGWRVGTRISTLRVCWHDGCRYTAQLSGSIENRAKHDAAWREVVASFTLL